MSVKSVKKAEIKSLFYSSLSITLQTNNCSVRFETTVNKYILNNEINMLHFKNKLNIAINK